MHNISLVFRTHFLRSGDRTDKKLKFLLVLLAQMTKNQAHANGMVGSFDLGAASHHGIVDAKHEKQLSAYRERRDRFNIAAGKADIAQIAKDRRRAFIAAQFNATGYMETLLVSPCSWHV